MHETKFVDTLFFTGIHVYSFLRNVFSLGWEVKYENDVNYVTFHVYYIRNLRPSFFTKRNIHFQNSDQRQSKMFDGPNLTIVVT